MTVGRRAHGNQKSTVPRREKVPREARPKNLRTKKRGGAARSAAKKIEGNLVPREARTKSGKTVKREVVPYQEARRWKLRYRLVWDQGPGMLVLESECSLSVSVCTRSKSQLTALEPLTKSTQILTKIHRNRRGLRGKCSGGSE